MEIFGVPLPAMLSQLLLGLVNGSFYAMLSLGLAVIFGLLNVINFAHGALFMLGAVLTWMGFSYLGLPYWLMLPVALWYWWQQADSSTVNLLQNSWTLNLWLAAAGVITTVPLLCFIGAARRLQLSTMGFFQYIGPSFMFVFGVWLFGKTWPRPNC